MCKHVAQVFLQLWAKSLAGPGVHSQHAAYLGHSTGTERKRNTDRDNSLPPGLKTKCKPSLNIFNDLIKSPCT